MGVKYELVSFEFGNCLPYGWRPFEGKFGGGVMGHEFTMVGIFRLKKDGRKHDLPPALPALIWREKEFWFEGNLAGTAWTYKGETDKGDLYQTSPGSPTWGGFRQGISDARGHIWMETPGGDVEPKLQSKLMSPSQYALVNIANRDVDHVKSSKSYRKADLKKETRGKYNESMLDMWWQIVDRLATKRRELPCVALDRPGIAISGGSGRSGGGFTSKTTAPSRRRILQFDLGITGSTGRFTATQVLETIDGEPSISKFLIPGKDDHWCRNIPDRYLAYLRSRLNPANVEDQTTHMEDEATIKRLEDWTAGLKRKGLI